jgi:hypothetical protein
VDKPVASTPRERLRALYERLTTLTRTLDPAQNAESAPASDRLPASIGRYAITRKLVRAEWASSTPRTTSGWIGPSR